MSVKNVKNNTEEPAIEVIVRAGGEEIAVFAFFKAFPLGWDVVVGITDPNLREGLKSAFESCALALDGAHFRPLDTREAEGVDDFPF